MDCAGVAGHLVAYHVGTLSPKLERDAVEAHLVECAACLKTYLALKRAADLQSESERPSRDARARLRADVARAFSPAAASKNSKNVTLFARRIPLYQGVALAAIAAAIAIATPSVLQKIARISDNAAATNIDTSRTKAESLAIY